MGLFDKAKPQAPVAGSVQQDDSGTVATDTSATTPVAQEPVVPTAAATVTQEPVTTSMAGVGSGVGTDATTDDSGIASTPIATAGQEPAAKVEAPEPELSAPPAPPTVSSSPVAESPITAGSGVDVAGDETAGVTEDTLEEAPAPPLGQVPVASEPDETEGAGGTGLTGK